MKCAYTQCAYTHVCIYTRTHTWELHCLLGILDRHLLHIGHGLAYRQTTVISGTIVQQRQMSMCRTHSNT